MTNLTELSAKELKPLLVEGTQNGVWQVHLIFGKGDQACHDMRKWADAHRAGRLVEVPEDAVERMARVLAEKFVPMFAPLTAEKLGHELATAALRALTGGEHG